MKNDQYKLCFGFHRYMLTTKLDWSQTKRPIYTSRKCKSFNYWVTTLTGYLASKVRH